MLMERMKEREKSLMIPSVLSATYLDPEYQVHLTEEQRNPAKIELQAFYLWKTSAAETPRGQLVQ